MGRHPRYVRLCLLLCVGLVFVPVPSTSAGPRRAVPSVRAGSAIQAVSNPAIEFVSGMGGALTAIAMRGTLAYVGEGASLVVLDMSNPAAIAQRGRVPLSDNVRYIRIEGQRLFVSLYYAIQVFDLSTPTQPTLLGTYDTSTSLIADLRVVGTRAYVLDSAALRIVDVHDVTQPTILGAYVFGEYDIVLMLDVTDGLVYVLDPNHGVFILDVSNPSHITRLSTLKPQSDAIYNIYIAQSRLYLGGNEGVEVYDLTQPSAPTLIGRFGSAARMMQVVGNIAYVSGNEHINIFDIGDLAHVVAHGSYSVSSTDFAVVGNSLDVVERYQSHRLRIIDVSNPDSLSVKGAYPNEPLFPAPYRVQVDGQRMYVSLASATYQPELQVFDISNPVSPTLQVRYAPLDNLQIVGQRAFVISQEKLQLLDTSTTSPILRQVYAPARIVRVIGNLAYIINGSLASYQLQIVDIGDLDHPVVRSTLSFDALHKDQDLSSRVDGVYAVGQYVFIYGSYPFGCGPKCDQRRTYVQVVDVHDVAHPVLGGAIDPMSQSYNSLPANLQTINVIALSATQYLELPSLKVFDIAKINAPTMHLMNNATVCSSYQIVGNLVYIVCSTASQAYNQLAVIDLSQPATPTLRTKLLVAASSLNYEFIKCLQVSDGFAYLADQSGLLIVDIHDADHLVLRASYSSTWFGQSAGITDMVAAGTILYTAHGDGGLQIRRIHPNQFLPVVPRVYVPLVAP